MARKYDRDFKLDAIRMASEEGHSAADVERRLGLSTDIISRWKKQLKAKGDEVFPGIGHLSDGDEENRRLRREVGTSVTGAGYTKQGSREFNQSTQHVH